jgi:hypothetical protein
MQLLARTLRTFRQIVGSNGWFTLLIFVGLLAIEVGGRTSPSDWFDLFAAMILGGVLIAVVWQHRRSPLPWVQPITRLLSALGEWLKRWFVEVGYDLRGDPPVKRGVPPIVFGIFGLLLAWSAILLAVGDYFPQALRAFGVNFFYVGYLFVMSLIWGASVLGICIALWAGVGFIHDDLAADGRGPRVSRGGLFLAVVSLLILGSRLVPLWQVLSLCLVAWGALTLIAGLGNSGDVRFLWRPRQSTRVRSVSAPKSAAIMFGIATLIALNLVVTGAGALVWKDPAEARGSMQWTVMLGTALGWALLAVLWVFVWQAAKERLRSPARRARRVLHIRGLVTRSTHKALRAHYRRRYWRIEYFPHEPDPCAVQIEIVEPTRTEAREFDPAWPLKLCLDDLDDEMVRDRILRRSDLQARRRLIVGMERIFKVAKRRKYRNGHGYWVAPHLDGLWNGLRRDEPEPDPGPLDPHMVHDNIGPAYHRAIPRLARHLAHGIMRGLQIDLIFVEDGVTFRRFSKVLRRIFELHDKAPNRPVEDLHFVGLTGMKVLVYEFQFDNPYESDTYPEPKFTALGRARILLVFRDRSESEELVEPPFDASRTPAPLARG